MQYMQNRKVRKPTISLRLPPKLLGEVDDLVGRAHMKSRTELLERAIEAYVQDLRDSKVVVVKPWTEPKARAAIVKYLRRKPSAFVSEICEALGIDFELGFRVVRRRARRGERDKSEGATSNSRQKNRTAARRVIRCKCHASDVQTPCD